MADEPLHIPLCRIGDIADLPLPRYMSEGAAGMDLFAAVETAKRLLPGERCLIPTGIALAVPPGFEAQIRPRSGLALRYGVTVLNSPGTIDSDYRGEVRLIMANFGSDPFTIHRGDRIGQMVIHRVFRATLEERDTLDDTPRGPGGFGHTGR